MFFIPTLFSGFPISIILLLYEALVNIPNCPAIGALNVTLAGCQGPKEPGLLTPFSDLCDFNVIPNLFTGPDNPNPFVSPLKSITGAFENTSETEISLL